MKYALATALLLIAAPASADIYSLTLGNFGISGTITTDGTQGALDPGNIVDWSITLSYPTAPWFPAYTLTPGNSFQGSNFGPALWADSNGLHWNFSANDNEYLDIQVRSIPPSPCNCWLVLTTNYSSSPDVMRYSGWAGGDQSYLMPGPGSTLIAASVPEPATWALLLIAFGMIGATFRELRRA